MTTPIEHAAAVAGVLGNGWTGEPGPYTGSAYLAHPDGRRLFLRIDNRTGRLRISGSYPDGCHPRSPVFITVNPARTPASIAGDITRRLLPAYEPALADAKARHAELQRAQTGREHAARRVLALVRGSRRSHPDYQTQAEIWLPAPPNDRGLCAGGWVKIRDDGSEMDLELAHVPAETALRVLTLVHGHASESPAPFARPHRARRVLSRLTPGRQQVTGVRGGGER